MPITPRIAPRARPDGQLAHRDRATSPAAATSRSARARMISEVACEPELPPELMIERDEQREHDRLAQLALEVLHRGGGEHLAQEERAEPARRASGSSSPKPICSVRLVERLHAAELLHVLGLLLATMASITSSTVTMPRRWPPSSTTGTASRSYLAMSRATSSRSVQGPTVTGGRRSPTSSRRARGIGQHQLAERHHVHEAAVHRIEHVHRVDRAARVPGAADLGEGALDRPGGGRLHVLGGHDAARGGRGVAQERAERGARATVDRGHEPRPGTVGEAAEDRARRGSSPRSTVAPAPRSARS